MTDVNFVVLPEISSYKTPSLSSNHQDTEHCSEIYLLGARSAKICGHATGNYIKLLPTVLTFQFINPWDMGLGTSKK